MAVIFSALKSHFVALRDLVYTRHCAGCGAALLRNEAMLCIPCQIGLPLNPHFGSVHNEVYEAFVGRLPLVSAHALLYFTKSGIAQALIHALKYHDREDIGEFLGQMLGQKLRGVGHYADVVIPVPLHPDKEKVRGYNQSNSIARGVATALDCTVNTESIRRITANKSQTRLSRAKRWDNVRGIFELANTEALINKHVLVVDDTLTTGATLESCCSTLLEVPGLTLSIATLALAK